MQRELLYVEAEPHRIGERQNRVPFAVVTCAELTHTLRSARHRRLLK
jgi:hypothetical protein